MDHAGKFYLGHIGPVPLYVGFEALFLVVYVYILGAGLEMPFIIALFMVFILTIVLHELGHALVALTKGMHGVSITIGALGGYCSYVGDRHPGKELAISLSGPAVNLSIAAICYTVISKTHFDSNLATFFLEQMFRWNLTLGILNLLPIYPLDGGQAALSIGRMIASERKARSFTLGLSVVVALVAVSWLIVSTAGHGGQLPMFTIFIAFTLVMAAYRDLR